MFGRVSRTPIANHLAFYRSSNFGYGYQLGGVYLGKKHTGQFIESGYGGSYSAVINGWVEGPEYDRTYPDYSMPDNLPPWVKTKYLSGGNMRRFIIDTDGLVGPFSFHEALRIYATVRRAVVKTTGSLSATTPTLSASSADAEDNTWQYPLVEYENEGPLYLINAGNVSSSADWRFHSDSSSDYDGSGVGTDASVSVELGVNPEYLYADSLISIVMDVDNFSEYYLAGLPFYYEETCSAQASKSVKVARAGREDEFPDVFNLQQSYSNKTTALYYALGKFKKQVSAGFYVSGEMETAVLSSNGGSATFTNNGTGESSYSPKQTVTFTVVNKGVPFEFGGITKTVTVYGIKSEREISWGEDPPAVSVSGVGSSTVKVKGTDYWPYKNANGQPVYNTTTGAIINPPIP
jgi:hypothetical protein